MRMTTGNERGFTLTEMMLVLAIGLIIGGLTLAGIPAMLKTSRADGGLAGLASALRGAREAAISNRRNVRVTFGTNTVIATRVEYCASPCSSGPSTTTLKTSTLEGRAEFALLTSPALPDTPDAFGNASAIALGTLVPAMFTTDGSFIDSNGDVLNGTIFMSIPGDRLSARAVTIFGPTGAMRLWRWDGRAWVEV